MEEIPSTMATDLGKQNKITDMLDRRHKERQITLGNVQEQKIKTNESTENVDYFLNTFNDQSREITVKLSKVATIETNLIPDSFNDIAKSLQQLQNYLSSSTLFLPDSIVKRYQNTINELHSSLEGSKTKLMPKKRFGFRSKAAAATEDSPALLLEPAKKPTVLHSTIQWTVENKQNEEIVLSDDDINGKDITISSLTGCLVRLVGHPGSVQLSHLKDCLVISGPVARSVFVDDCTNSTLTFGCQQFRLHRATNCSIYMHVTCRGIIEDCSKISVAPFTFSYDGYDMDFKKAGLDLRKNNWDDIADFNWLSADKVSPNWKKIPENEWISDWLPIIDTFRKDMSI